MVNRPRGHGHFTIRHTPDFTKGRRLRPWMLLPLIVAVVMLGFGGNIGGKPPSEKPPAAANGVVPAQPGALQDIISSLGESQWGQETLDQAELLRQGYLLQTQDIGCQTAAEYLRLLLAPTHPDAVEQPLLEQLAVFLGDTDTQATQGYREALETVYLALEKGTD